MEPRRCSIELVLAALALPRLEGGLVVVSDDKLGYLAAAVVVAAPPTLASNLTSRFCVDKLASFASTAIFYKIICFTWAIVELC